MQEVPLQNAHHGGQSGAHDGRNQGLEGGESSTTGFGNLNFSPFQANTEKPKWNEEELETRTGVMSLVKLLDTASSGELSYCQAVLLLLLLGGGEGGLHRGGAQKADHSGHECPRCWRYVVYPDQQIPISKV